jgi:hypothetical protein
VGSAPGSRLDGEPWRAQRCAEKAPPSKSSTATKFRCRWAVRRGSYVGVEERLSVPLRSRVNRGCQLIFLGMPYFLSKGSILSTGESLILPYFLFIYFFWPKGSILSTGERN